jgi:excisionase family DNA binding protein
MRPEVTGKKIISDETAERQARLLVKIPEACDMLAVSRSRLYELMDAGKIMSVKDGKSRKPVVASINAYVAELIAASQKAAA